VPQFILLFLCLLLGWTLKHFKKFPINAPQTLSGFIIYISLPALAILNLHKLQFSDGLWFPIVMPWMLFLLSAIFFIILGKVFRWSKKTTGCLILVSGLGNTSFVGFPMLEALIGPEAIPIATILDQLGSFLVVSVLGVITASVYSSGRVDTQSIIKKIISFPPFWAVIFGLSTRGVQFPDLANFVLERLAGTLTPLALVSVGLQLELSPQRIRKIIQPLSMGLTFKLLLVPLFFFTLGKLVVSDPLIFKVTVLESAMAPMITAGIIATQFDLESDLAAQLVGVGIVLSLVSVPFWGWLVN
jgi:predicted permease